MTARTLPNFKNSVILPFLQGKKAFQPEKAASLPVAFEEDSEYKILLKQDIIVRSNKNKYYLNAKKLLKLKNRKNRVVLVTGSVIIVVFVVFALIFFLLR